MNLPVRRTPEVEMAREGTELAMETLGHALGGLMKFSNNDGGSVNIGDINISINVTNNNVN